VELDCDIAALYGAAFAESLCGAPSSCFVADGSPIVVRRARRLDLTGPTAEARTGR
jgi:hypothetical protein